MFNSTYVPTSYVSEVLSLKYDNLNGSHDPDNALLNQWYVMRRLELAMINPCTSFAVYSFTRSKVKKGDAKYRQSVSAAAHRSTLRSGSARAKYSVSHPVVIKPFLLLSLAAEYRSRLWV